MYPSIDLTVKGRDGFIPVLLEQADYASIHGHDERISLENVRLGTQVLFELVRRLAM